MPDVLQDTLEKKENNHRMVSSHCIDFQHVLNAAKNIQGIAYKTPVMTCASLNNSYDDGNVHDHVVDNDKDGTSTAASTGTATATVTAADASANMKLFFKVEAMQRTGSFKFRGALNAILSLVHERNCNRMDATAPAGNALPLQVVTHSSGNHAAALALAAKLASSLASSRMSNTSQEGSHSHSHSHSHSMIQATIVMPENAPRIKVEGVKGYGGKIVMVESTNEAREEKADEIVKQEGAYFIHPSEDVRVIAGQGTVCLEFVEQVREMLSCDHDAGVDSSSGCGGGGSGEKSYDLDIVIIPVGGGGLAAGNAVALRGLLGRNVKIILAEPQEMDDAKRSKEAGMLLKHEPGNKLNSVADGLKTTLGPNTWPIIRDLVDDIMTVSEYEILRATKLVWERLKVCIEPSAGVGVAVALGKEFQSKYCNMFHDNSGSASSGGSGRVPNVGIVLCGGNVDIVKISKLMENVGL